MTALRPVYGLALGALGLATSASAQTLLYTKNGDLANDRLSTCVRSAGDVNNDGRPDWVVGAPEDANVFASGEGYARVFSGANGSTLYTFHGTQTSDRFGTSVDGAGDVNNDGFADIVVGAPLVSLFGNNRGQMKVYSGANGSVLWTFDGSVNLDKLGYLVVGVGDVNNDGRPDILSASREAPGGGTQRGNVKIYSGLNGTILHNINGTSNNQRLGLAATGMGDVNGDNRADFALSGLTGGVKVYSGATGAILYSIPTPLSTDIFGASLGSVASLTGDAIPDLLIGATQDGNIFQQGPGYVHLHNGQTGAFVRAYLGSTVGDRFGCSVADAGDLNGDGTTEVMIGADQFNNVFRGYVRVFDGVTSVALHTFEGLADGDRFGYSIDGLGNLDGLPGLELGMGSPEHMTAFQAQGRAEVWTAALGGACATPYTYCVATNNSTGQPALMSYTGTVSIAANNFALVCTGLPSSAFGLFYYGPNETQQVFGNGFRCVSGSVWRLGVQQANNGVMTRAINYGNLPPGGQITPGLTRKFQCWYRNPAAGGAGYNLSNGLSASFCN